MVEKAVKGNFFENPRDWHPDEWERLYMTLIIFLFHGGDMAATCKALGCNRTTIGLNIEKLVLGLIYITDMEADEKTVLERRQKILGAIKGMEEYLETFKIKQLTPVKSKSSTLH